jgi:hypothetical protein
LRYLKIGLLKLLRIKMSKQEIHKPSMMGFVRMLIEHENSAVEDLESGIHEKLKSNRDLFIKYADQVVRYASYGLGEEKECPFEESYDLKNLKLLFTYLKNSESTWASKKDRATFIVQTRKLNPKINSGEVDEMMARLQKIMNLVKDEARKSLTIHPNQKKSLGHFEVLRSCAQKCHLILVGIESVIRKTEEEAVKKEALSSSDLGSADSAAPKKKSKKKKKNKKVPDATSATGDGITPLNFESTTCGRFLYVALPGDEECDRVFYPQILPDGRMGKFGDGFVFDGEGNPLNVHFEINNETGICAVSCKEKDWKNCQELPSRTTQNDGFVDLEVQQYTDGRFIVKFPDQEEWKEVFCFKNCDELGKEIIMPFPHAYVLDHNNFPIHIHLEAKEYEVVEDLKNPNVPIQRYAGLAICTKKGVEQYSWSKVRMSHVLPSEDGKTLHPLFTRDGLPNPDLVSRDGNFPIIPISRDPVPTITANQETKATRVGKVPGSRTRS